MIRLLIKERWFWKLVVFFLILLIVPAILAWIIITAPPLIMWSSVLGLFIVWWLFRGYRDHIRKDRKNKNLTDS